VWNLGVETDRAVDVTGEPAVLCRLPYDAQIKPLRGHLDRHADRSIALHVEAHSTRHAPGTCCVNASSAGSLTTCSPISSACSSSASTDCRA
jgi:hypothetical protein